MFFYTGQVPTFKYNTYFPYERQIAAVSIFIGLVFHFVSSILMIMMISELQVKYTSTDGVPITLSGKYAKQMDNYKSNLLTVFFVASFLLLWLIYGSVPTVPFFQYKIWQIVIAVGSILLSGTLISISSWQVYIANDFSKLKYRQLV
jgi:hypothetical protein